VVCRHYTVVAERSFDSLLVKKRFGGHDVW
jgi:hypothetical protein